MAQITKILVPTDMSEQSLAVMDLARILKERFGATISLMYVVDNVPVLAYPLPAEIDTDKIFRDTVETAKLDLKLFVSDKLAGDETIERIVGIGTPDEEIIRYAVDHKYDLILIATHGRTGLKHILIGSVAERVVRHSPVPVLTVKPTS